MPDCVHHEAVEKQIGDLKLGQIGYDDQLCGLYDKMHNRPTTGVLLTIASILCVILVGLFGTIWYEIKSNNKDLQLIFIQTAQIATALDIKIKPKIGP